ncbi:MAG: exopolysaccharide biosynthesis polyprenyl glycosylphosphotransferase [Rubrivivax sp.]|nr:exopolysaccharide biosynthesis polyprenyl glycosylphosphotransferase [Rubrivivax sp.]
MLYHNVRVLAHAASVIDATVVCAAASLVWWLAGLDEAVPWTPALSVLLLTFAAAFMLIGGRMRLYHPWRTESLWRELLALSEATAYALGLGTLAATVLVGQLPGPLLAAMLGAGWLALMAFRASTRWLLRRLRSRGDDYRVWLVVGHNSRSAELMADIRANPQYGVRIAALLDVAGASTGRVPSTSSSHSPPPHHVPLPDGVDVQTLADAEGLRAVLSMQVIDEVVITLPVRSCYDLIQDMLRICSQAGISVKLLPEAFVVPESSRHLATIGRTPVLTHYSGTGHYGQLLLKRLIDMLGAAAGLLLLSPLLLLLLLAVRLGSPGPALFRQTRTGLHGRPFTMLKIRTMFVDAEARKTELSDLNERDGTAFKLKDDPRITPIGRRLRKFHIDELPQLWNVLVGDMSLVGPRPLPVREATGNEWWQRRRLTVPPGLTCLWQLKDDPVIPFQQWMRMDMDYIDRWSVWLDLKIIVQTFGTLVRGRGW